MPATQWPIARTGNYHSTHKHVRRVRGPASEHACRCGSAADQWAYDHADPDEVQGKHPYSLKPEHYRPLCRSCHVKEDGARARARPLSGEPRGPRRRCLRCGAGCRFDYCTKHHVTVKRPPAPSLVALGLARSAGRPRLSPAGSFALSGEVKHCRSCDTTKPVESFTPRKDKPGVRRYRCRECDRSYANNRHSVVGSPGAPAHRADKLRAADRERHRSNRAAALAIYGGCCEWCGLADQLEFDHVDGDGDQHREVESSRRLLRRIARTGARLTTHRLRLLCAPCHRGPGWRERRAAHDHLALTG